MELWIRSQDKHTLIKVDYLYSEIKEFDGGFRIYVMPDEIEIAKYKSKERALEVLDEIQNYILLPNTDNSAYVYIMPKE